MQRKLQSAQLILPIWDKARIPTKSNLRVRELTFRLYKTCQSLKKNINRTSNTKQEKRRNFGDELENLLDIANHDAMNLIKINEDIIFTGTT